VYPYNVILLREKSESVLPGDTESISSGQNKYGKYTVGIVEEGVGWSLKGREHDRPESRREECAAVEIKTFYGQSETLIRTSQSSRRPR